MIIFARAPGTTGWVEIKPEEELSHRGQFWEIRKFAVESDDALPLARRLDRAEQALRAAGFYFHGKADRWIAPKKPTDISQRLREYAGNNGFSHNDYADTMRAAAEEIERYYGGMMAWKEAAEAKDRATLETAPALSDAYRALLNTLLVVPESDFKQEMDDWLAQRLGVIDGVPLPVPTGWKLVPVEPTDAMASAALGVALDDRSINGVAQYRAMLSAAPEAPGGAA